MRQNLLHASNTPKYIQRKSEETLLYKVIQENLNGFNKKVLSEGGSLPGYIKKELYSYLRCGVLAYGFVRLKCSHCNHEKLVPFSCKGRGFCPSCGGRRMNETAANLQIIQMAYNLMISMQIDVGLAPKKNNKNKKTTRKYLCMKMKTLRFLIIYKAVKIVYDNGCKVLKLTANKSTEELYNKVQTNLDKAA